VLIQRLITALQGRIPSLVDVARDVQYRYVDQPSFERVRDVVQSEMAGLVAALAAESAYQDDDERLQSLVECTQPLRTVLAGSLSSLDTAGRLVTLDVMLRRDYRIRALRFVRRLEETEPPIVLGAYDHDGQVVNVVSLCAPATDIEQALGAVRAVAAEFPSEQDVVAELYVWGSAPAGEADSPGRGAGCQAGAGRVRPPDPPDGGDRGAGCGGRPE